MALRFRLFLVLMICASALMAQPFDLVIRGGRVVDGTGEAAFVGDVGIRGGRIVAVGEVKGESIRELDAKGMVVAPGFIDVHTHAEDIEEMPGATNFLRMGVTTLVLGNCGFSKTDLGAYFAKLEKEGIAANVASLIGQGAVRSQVMGGSFLRPPTDDEMERMKKLVDQAMRDGAVGLSTGLIYLPGTFSKTEELIELAKVIAPYDGIYASHMRSESRDIYKALDELIRISKEAGVRAEVSHLKLSTKPMWGQTGKVLAKIEKARADGLQITQDVYLYPASSTSLSQLIPEEIREGGTKRYIERISDPKQKEAVIAEMKATLEKGLRGDYAYAVIASCEHDASLNGLNVVQAAKRSRGSDTIDEQIELILDIHKHGGASAVFHGMSEDDMRVFLKHPNTMVASDSGVRKFQEGVPHPRGYGNSARLLGIYVRELQVLSLEDAIRRMTSLPASVFHLAERGVIREGARADMVVFDPATVRDNATFESPHQYATGFRHVLVNGVVTVENDIQGASRAGMVLRSAPKSSK